MTPATTSAQIQTEATIRIADFTTLPNLLSLARIAGVAAAVLLYFEGHPHVTVILATAAVESGDRARSADGSEIAGYVDIGR